MKVKDIMILDLSKRSNNLATQLKECTKLYELVKNERNTIANSIQTASQAIAEQARLRVWGVGGVAGEGRGDGGGILGKVDDHRDHGCDGCHAAVTRLSRGCHAAVTRLSRGCHGRHAAATAVTNHRDHSGHGDCAGRFAGCQQQTRGGQSRGRWGGGRSRRL